MAMIDEWLATDAGADRTFKQSIKQTFWIAKTKCLSSLLRLPTAI